MTLEEALDKVKEHPAKDVIEDALEVDVSASYVLAFLLIAGWQVWPVRGR